MTLNVCYCYLYKIVNGRLQSNHKIYFAFQIWSLNLVLRATPRSAQGFILTLGLGLLIMGLGRPSGMPMIEQRLKAFSANALPIV